MDGWVEHGGDAVFTAKDAKEEAKRHIENAIGIFKEVSKNSYYTFVYIIPLYFYTHMYFDMHASSASWKWSSGGHVSSFAF